MFYDMGNAGHAKFFYAAKDLSFKGVERKACAVCGRDVYTWMYFRETHQLVIEGGKHAPDYLQFCGAGARLVLLSEHAAEILTRNNITGFSAGKAVEIYREMHGKNCFLADNIQTYYTIDVWGTIDFDYPTMFLKKKRTCDECGQYSLNRERLYPVHLSQTAWDGSDWCSLATLPGRKFCTDRFRCVVEKNKLTNFSFAEVKIV